MTALQQQKTETEKQELSETELNQVVGGIIAVLQPKLCDGSVVPAPVATPAQRSFGIFGI